MGGGTGESFVVPTVDGHNKSACSSCRPGRPDGSLTETEWRAGHTTQWCQNSSDYINKADKKGRFEDDLSRDGHSRCQCNGGLVSERYQCQCLCHQPVSDDEVEEAAFHALQMLLEMREHAQHKP